jgi:hypothetical protein
MAADITRSTFNPLKHYSGVRQQQGRVSIDADSNEQVDIAAHRVQTETADVVGLNGAPRDNAGFQIVPLPQQGASSDLALTPGRMYASGFLCELESTPVAIVGFPAASQVQVTTVLVDGQEFAIGQWVQISAADSTAPAPLVAKITAVSVATQILTLSSSASAFAGKTGPQLQRITTYLTQPDLVTPAPPPSTGFALAYLDVWERSITALEDPQIRELALGQAGSVDTATRTKTVWQVKLGPVGPTATCATAPDFATLVPPSTAKLAARSEPTAPSTGACILPPRAGFRRLENQLYRVEIHVGGALASGAPTFKWSRDNGSIVTAIVSPAPALSGKTITINVSSLGRDQVLGFAVGQWVELTDDGRELAGVHGILVQLTGASAGPQGPILTADTTLADPTDLSNFLNGFTNQTVRNPKVRRWDQSGAQVSATAPGGDMKVQEGTWIDLESGVQVFFQPGANYQTGDHWLIPARTVTGDVDWPRDSAGDPQLSPPSGIRHHYCRLGIVNFNTSPWTLVSDCRQLFPPLADAGIHITQVYLTNASSISLNGGLLLNDATVSLQDLAGGISVACDTPIDPVSLLPNPTATVSKPTCIVTIDVPNFVAAGQAPFAVQPMVVCANLNLDALGSTITWSPTQAASSWMQNQLPPILNQTPPPGPLLAHLRLKGNFIWARGNPSLYLNGAGFGSSTPPDTVTGFQRTDELLPSGDGRRGGDFEMWFWLISLPAVVVAPTSATFGNQPQGVPSGAIPLTLTNNSKTPLTIASIAATGDFAVTSTTCPNSPTTLAVGASCTINVTFTPTQAGLRTGAVTVTHNAAGSPLTIPLSGVGLAPSLLASATTLNFVAIVGGSVDQTLTLTNSGSSPLVINSMLVSGAAAGDYQLSASGSVTLPPGGAFNVDVQFSPSVVGTRNAIVTIVHNAANSPLVITLNGRGIFIKQPPPHLGGGPIVIRQLPQERL